MGTSLRSFTHPTINSFKLSAGIYLMATESTEEHENMFVYIFIIPCSSVDSVAKEFIYTR